jgi:hypothetical protein
MTALLLTVGALLLAVLAASVRSRNRPARTMPMRVGGRLARTMQLRSRDLPGQSVPVRGRGSLGWSKRVRGRVPVGWSTPVRGRGPLGWSTSIARRGGDDRSSGPLGLPGSSVRSHARAPAGRRRHSAGRPARSLAGSAGRHDHPSRSIAELLTRIRWPGRATRLRREMEEAVPEVIDVLRATVAAGINPRRALRAAAEGAPPPLEALLGRSIRAAELGSGAGQALAAAAEAERLNELMLAGEALDLAEATGAPPGPVLAGVAAAAADRVRARQARMAATAQARLSARVVAAMAPAFLGVLALTSPSDAAFLVREPFGWATLATATAFEVLGICWATHIVRDPAP